MSIKTESLELLFITGVKATRRMHSGIVFMPPKEIRVAYQNLSVRLSVRPLQIVSQRYLINY